MIAERGRARAFSELLAAQTSETAATPLTEFSLDQIKGLAQQQKTTFVQYSIIRQPSPGRSRFDNRLLYIWVIQPSGNIHFEQVNLTQQPNSIQELLIASQDSLGVRGFNAWGSAAKTAQATPDVTQINLKQLYELVIAPIDSYLPESPTEKVVVVPHRELFLIPFPALQTEPNKAVALRQAMLSTLAEHPDPRDWAAFFLIGL